MSLVNELNMSMLQMENVTQDLISAADPQPAGDIAVDNLYPALLECFAVILCGYVAGRMNLISQTETKGLSTFVGSFSLPALIFLSLAELDLSSVNWMFLLSVLVAKTVVFLVVVVVTLLVSRPVNTGRAGLFAIFCTQSNDFAIGYPIVGALYQKTHPDYASYLYLMAPISLVILNPLGFILMELSKHDSSAVNQPGNHGTTAGTELSRKNSKLQVAGAVAKSIILNPIVLMTALGIVGNLVFSHMLPVALSGILKILGSAFSATALFLLGLRMVGKVHTLQGATLVVPGILIAVKLLVLPLVIHEVVSLFHPGTNTSETLDLSTYGFLYGVFPAAPGVFVFATQYSLDVDLIASSMVACTFISAPLMFISAKMITINKLKPSDYLHELDSFALDVSIAGIFACVWILVLFICSKKYKRIPHKITFCLVVSQLIGCVGTILWSLLDRSDAWTLYLQFVVYAIGVYSSRLWTAFLAIALLFLQCRSLCFVLKLQPLFIVLGWGGPLVVVTALILSVDPDYSIVEKRNPNFQYGEVQAAIAVFILVISFIVTIGCLVLHQRYQRRYARYLLLVQDVSGREDASDVEYDDTSPQIVHTTSVTECGTCEGSPSPMHQTESHQQVVDIEEIMSDRGHTFRSLHEEGNCSSPGDICPARFGCPSAQRDQCRNVVKHYHTQEAIEEEDSEEDRQTLRHIVLLILLACSMFVGIALSVWTLVMEEMSGIYVELAFLDASFNFGQSLIVFAIFGLDPKCVIQPLVKRWRCLLYGAAELKLPAWEDLGFETKHVCDQFATHHLEKCRRDIATDRRWHLKHYKETFSGSALVDWLLGVGLARDRNQAVQYARHLLEGRVIRHVENLYHFHDQTTLYTFMSVQDRY
ncbi:Integral membrane protein GPR155 [Cryptotermes secundus]|uniref:Integral membrane protein GPR155 n=2 Tax=Cryptotermes secundus TaxID=105785 RepID=A0A2J7QU41_9NEOP|nr:integral membrane protein GPR155 isoform X1 [Cryptotermes secundus]PNF32094.1 Integral membrane protein GPR155 [Cryptotermes secundus]